MINRISEDIKNAMKNRESEKLAALRYLKSMLLENKTSKSPIPELDVVIKHCKKLKDSIELFPQGNEKRQEIARELEFLAPYLPQALDEEAVRNLITQIISKLEQPNFPAVMKELSPQIKGRFDGKTASQLVKEMLM